MKKFIIVIAAILTLAAPMAHAAEKDHAGHGKNHGDHKAGSIAHQQVIEGVKATFTVKTMQEAMKEMGMALPKGVKETHHISVSFINVKTGKPITEGEVKVKVQTPDKSEQTKDMAGMHGHFGADFELAKKGKYGIMCRSKLPDGKIRSSKFWYEVK